MGKMIWAGIFYVLFFFLVFGVPVLLFWANSGFRFYG